MKMFFSVQKYSRQFRCAKFQLKEEVQPRYIYVIQRHFNYYLLTTYDMQDIVVHDCLSYLLPQQFYNTNHLKTQWLRTTVIDLAHESVDWLSRFQYWWAHLYTCNWLQIKLC